MSSMKREAVVDLTEINESEDNVDVKRVKLTANDQPTIVEKKAKMSMIKAPSRKAQQVSLHGFLSSKKSISSYTADKKSAKANQKYKVYCDLDGVLCDFDSGVRKIFKGKGMDDLKIGVAWAGITRANNFYGDLPWTKDGKELWEAIQPLHPDILTGVPTSRKSSRVEKAEWCARELGVTINHVDFAAPKRRHDVVHGALRKDMNIVNVITCWSNNKHYKSGVGKVLIDDTEKLMAAWEAKGGIFILHKNTKNTLKQLHKLGILPKEGDCKD